MRCVQSGTHFDPFLLLDLCVGDENEDGDETTINEDEMQSNFNVQIEHDPVSRSRSVLDTCLTSLHLRNVRAVLNEDEIDKV